MLAGAWDSLRGAYLPCTDLDQRNLVAAPWTHHADAGCIMRCLCMQQSRGRDCSPCMGEPCAPHSLAPRRKCRPQPCARPHRCTQANVRVVAGTADGLRCASDPVMRRRAGATLRCAALRESLAYNTLASTPQVRGWPGSSGEGAGCEGSGGHAENGRR